MTCSSLGILNEMNIGSADRFSARKRRSASSFGWIGSASILRSESVLPENTASMNSRGPFRCRSVIFCLTDPFALASLIDVRYSSAVPSYAVPRKLLHALQRKVLTAPPTSLLGAWATVAHDSGRTRRHNGQPKPSVRTAAIGRAPSGRHLVARRATRAGAVAGSWLRTGTTRPQVTTPAFAGPHRYSRFCTRLGFAAVEAFTHDGRTQATLKWASGALSARG